MDVESRIALYEKLYTQEVERRDRIHTRLNFPFAALLALSGLISYIIQNIPLLSSCYAIFFWLLFLISMLANFIAFVFLCRSLLKFSDCFVASPAEMEKYYIDLKDHHGESKKSRNLVDAEFAQYRLDTFKEAATNTGKSNDKRSENIFYANVFVVIALVAILLSLIPFYLADNKKSTIESRNVTCQNKSHHLHHLVPAMSEVTYPSLDHQMCQYHHHLGHHFRHPKSR